jgi:hypothetical protein
MRDVDECSAQIFTDPLQLSRALVRSASRPALQTKEDDDNRRCDNQCH